MITLVLDNSTVIGMAAVLNVDWKTLTLEALLDADEQYVKTTSSAERRQH